MAKQTIDVGAFVDDPSAESIKSAFTKVNAMTLELFTEISLGGRQAIDLDTSPDTIRDAFVKTNTNASALYTAQSLPSVPVIDVGDAPDDTGAETIYAGFVKVNTIMTAVYGSLAPTTAADYYVATTGNNSNPGTVGSPFLTMAKGVSMLSAGKTLLVRGGTYHESLINTVPAGTSWANAVRIAAYPGETVWMQPAAGAARVLEFSGVQRYIEFDGINLNGSNITYDVVKINGATTASNAHHIRIKNAELINGSANNQGVLSTALVAGIIGNNEFLNLTVHGGGSNDFSHGFYIASPNNLIDGCEIYNVAGAGIHFWNNYNASIGVNNIARNNVIHDLDRQYTGSRQWGIILANGSGHKAYNNLIYNVFGDRYSAGITVFSAGGVEVSNNTIYNTGQYGIWVQTEAGTGILVRNNIAYQPTSPRPETLGTYRNDNGTDTTASHNVFTSNPLFVNAAGHNFHLQAGSPAISAGVAIGYVTTDLDGITRGTPPDIGAYEYVP